MVFEVAFWYPYSWGVILVNYFSIQSYIVLLYGVLNIQVSR